MSGGMGTIRVLIADGQAEVRRGLRMRLAIEPDIAVVGETGDTEQALALALTLAPDAIVVDVGMRGADGVSIVERLRSVAPAAIIVVLTLYGDEDTRVRAGKAGADAFLEKDGGGAALLQAIREIVSHRPREALCAAPGALPAGQPGLG